MDRYLLYTWLGFVSLIVLYTLIYKLRRHELHFERQTLPRTLPSARLTTYIVLSLSFLFVLMDFE